MDINTLKERLAALNRRTQKANDIWKPKDEHDVRLLRYPHSDDPLLTLHFHYEVGDVSSVLCPKMNYGDDCEICDFCDALRSWKGPDGEDKLESERKQDWELFKKIQPKARVFTAMVERGKESEGAKFWGLTPNQAQELLKECADGDRLSELGIDAEDAARALDVLYGKKAYDLHVSFAKPGEKGNQKTFAAVTFKAKIKATPVAKDSAAEKALLESIKRIDEVYPRVTSAEASRIFRRFVGEGSKEAKTDVGGEVERGPAPTNSREDARLSGTRSIDEAFADMVK